MAIIRASSIVGAISGSIGGLTFANSRRGLIARLRPGGTPKQSEAVNLQQIYFANISRAWRALSDVQRSAWRSAAETFPRTNRVGVASTPSGYTLFTQYNVNHVRWFTGILEDPPTEESPTIDISFEIAFAAGGPYNLVFTQPGHQSGSVIQIIGSRNFSQIVPRHPPNFREVANQFLSPLGAFTINIFDSWEAIFGSMLEGETFTLRVRYWVVQREFFPRAPLHVSSTVTA